MTIWAILLWAGATPGLFWEEPPATAAALKSAGVTQVFVPPEKAGAWKASGLAVQPFKPGTRVQRPMIKPELNVSSMSRTVWLVGNGWRYRRKPELHYFGDIPAAALPLAMAEAFAYGGKLTVKGTAESLPRYTAMAKFLESNAPPGGNWQPVFDIAMVDEGTSIVGECLNLMVRKNLLVRSVASKGAAGPLLPVEIGTEDFPKKLAMDPGGFATQVRYKLTDEKRSLRLFGTETVVGTIEQSAGRLRLHLLNYADHPVETFRVRLRGNWKPERYAGFEQPDLKLEEFEEADGGLEFTVPAIKTYIVLDLLQK